MFQLAAPLGLLALVTLLVPLVIHLVRKPLRTVKVGSLRFLQADRLNLHSVRWREWLLLALRCLMLAALALALAGLRWQPNETEPARWALLISGTTPEPATWESLRTDGFEQRWLASGFPRVDGNAMPPQGNLDAWSLLREADARLAPGSRAVVFGPAPTSLFRGRRPTLTRLQVDWRSEAGPSLSPVTTAEVPHTRVAIFHGAGREEDARYLRAAFTALGHVVFEDEKPEWIFRLGDGEMPAALRDPGAGVRIVTDPSDTVAALAVRRSFHAGGANIHLRQRTPPAGGVPLLLDSTGEALAMEERQGRAIYWRFALRFHPDWSDWTTSGAFPAWWQQQFRPARGPDVPVAAALAAPRFAPGEVQVTSPLPGLGLINLSPWCWVVAVVAFAVERWLSTAQRWRKVGG